MDHIEKVDNVYLIDSRMFGFERYSSIYLIKGEKIALIDTGLPTQLEAVRAGIRAHGFSVSDISYIFITHEHLDHYGNAGSLVMENPKATVYIHPEGLEMVTHPEIGAARRKATLPPEMAARFGEARPIPRHRIQLLNDGDVFDLGNNTELEVIFAPGHLPGGIVLLERNTKKLFIDDLVGNYFADADVQISLTPLGSDVKQAIKTLEKIMKLSPSILFLGHFGICDKPRELIQRAIDDMQQLIKIGIECLREGKVEEIAPRLIAHHMPKLEKIKATRGEEQYNYLKNELIPSFGSFFTKYILALSARAIEALG